MEYLIFKIGYLLRKSGINVTTTETRDCINVIKSIHGEKLNQFDIYNIINATMIKTSWGSEYAQWLIELYFGPDIEILSDNSGLLTYGRGQGKSLGLSTGKTMSLERLINAVVNNDIRPIFAALYNSDFNIDPNIEDPQKALAILQSQSMFNEVSHTLDQMYEQGDLNNEQYDASKKIMEEWNELLKDEMDRQLSKNMSEDYLLMEMEKLNPRKVSFLDSDNELLTSISKEIQKLGKKMAVKKGLRRKKSKRGTINAPKTIRKSLKTAGVPVNLIKMERKPSKPDLWILCDMSNSVSKFIYFMLMFVYSTQQQYSHIRSFVFVDSIMEATGYFKETNWEDALTNVKKIKGYNITAYSHYGNMLKEFHNKYLPSLNKQTTVIILGDAKNNGNSLESIDVLDEIKARAAALYWLNPLTEDQWDKKDCIMTKYKPHCTTAVSCTNVHDLEKFLNYI